MPFGTEIMRGVRLALIVIAVGLVGITLYRVLDVEVDDDDTVSASSPPATAPAPAPAAKHVKAPASGQAYPPPPPPLPGRAAAVAAKPAPRGRDIMVVDVPSGRETLMADASPLPESSTSSPVSATPAVPDTSVVPAVAIDTPAPVHHKTNKFVKTLRHWLHVTK